ncbi:DUF4249 domain-containing protein [Tenacibaculum ovolyticum]|uniref:DUF4249 domain-containing protein n=1 Tax=Tenacibaculum ovolyticum TaxID=104270 RepID=UPI000424F64B|nr:DUF4249 domain-containing protein [Tenacibaculum ovolyticum]
MSFSSCIEPLKLEDITFESHIVINTTITDEFKNHTINISKTIRIDSTGIDPEENALVSITDSNNVIYTFKDTGNGIYESINKFKAEPNKTYTLEIETNNGIKYISTPEELPLTSGIKDIYIDVEKSELNEIKAVVKTNSIGNSNIEGKFYRYEYEETFKVKTSVWNDEKIIIISDTPPYKFELAPKTIEDGIGFCYGTRKPKSIILTETKTLSQDKVLGFPVRSIPLNNYLIGIRYSILLKQYVLNKKTFDYYELLNKFSNPDNIFSQVQVGEILSNISSLSGDKVIGFFEVSTVSKKRVFFNRNEITSNKSFVNYNNTSGSVCSNSLIQPLITDTSGKSPMLNSLQNYIFQGHPNFPPIPPPNKPYILISKICGDCTHIGPATKPTFWID